MVQKYQNVDDNQQRQKVEQIIEYYKQQGMDLNEDQVYKLKFIHKKIVFISGIDSEMVTRVDIGSKKYFGQYGKVMSFSFRKETGNLHVGYENKRQASFAIIALSDFRSNKNQNHKQQLKVQFGTSKFCISFLKDQKCKNQDCQFIHELKKTNQIFDRTKLSLSSAYRTAQKSKSYLNKQIEVVADVHSEFPRITEVQSKLNSRIKSKHNLQKHNQSIQIDKSHNGNDIKNNQQTNRSLQNQSDIETTDDSTFNNILEQKSIDQIIVNRFVFGQIRNHKSRFEFAQQ